MEISLSRAPGKVVQKRENGLQQYQLHRSMLHVVLRHQPAEKILYGIPVVMSVGSGTATNRLTTEVSNIDRIASRLDEIFLR
jgi:hypothetical protein